VDTPGGVFVNSSAMKTKTMRLRLGVKIEA
jgi:hypothetical protein